MQFTTDQVITMAPDTSSVAAGKKLGTTKHWKSLGHNDEVLWGECQGSALYQVRVDLSNLTIKCSCPSRKQPCKHGLGLLFLAASTPSAISTNEPPEWVVSWLAKKAAVSKRKETIAKQATGSVSAPTATQKKTAEKRMKQVRQGLETLDLWLSDLIRNGLGGLETQSATFWERQAAFMVDNQAQDIASRIRRISEIPNASPNWPEKLLARLGHLALLTQAFQRIDQLDPLLQEDVRYLIGWALKEEEVLARGEHVTDHWLILGQITEEAPRGRSQRTWLLGTETKRSATIEQFAPPGGTYPQLLPVGACWQAELVYWPSAWPQRALIATRHEAQSTISAHFPTSATIEEFLEDVSKVLAQHPWRERFLCALEQAVLVYDLSSHEWRVCDRDRACLPLHQGDYWKLLALSGGSPVDFVGEWDGTGMTPLGLLVDHTYYTA